MVFGTQGTSSYEVKIRQSSFMVIFGYFAGLFTHWSETINYGPNIMQYKDINKISAIFSSFTELFPLESSMLLLFILNEGQYEEVSDTNNK